MLVVIFILSALAGAKYMNHLIDSASSKKQVERNNKMFIVVAIVAFILAMMVGDNVVGILLNGLVGCMFGLIFNSYSYIKKIEE
jgi:Na+(H+)/acetate symporter ActP